MDFEEAFAKCIFEGNTQGIKALGVDNECINDIVFLIFFNITNSQLVCDTPIPQKGDLLIFPSIRRPTPLIYAILCHQLNIVKLLFSLGADLKKSDENPILWHPVHYAAAVRDTEILDFILTNAPKEIEAETKDHKATPLHFAVTANNANMVALLLLRGANANHANVNNETALHMSMILFDSEIASLLLAFGAKLDSKNSRGLTPLEIANQRENKQMQKFLENYSSNPKIIPTKEDIKKRYSSSFRTPTDTDEEPAADPESIIGHLDILSQRISAVEEAVGLSDK